MSAVKIDSHTARQSALMCITHDKTQKSKLVWFLRRFCRNMLTPFCMCLIRRAPHIVRLPGNFHRCIMCGTMRHFWRALTCGMNWSLGLPSHVKSMQTRALMSD